MNNRLTHYCQGFLGVEKMKVSFLKPTNALSFTCCNRQGNHILQNEPWIERNPFQGYYNNVRNYIRSSANGKVINWIITVIWLERKMIKACDILSAFPFSYYYVHSVENVQLIGVGSGYNL